MTKNERSEKVTHISLPLLILLNNPRLRLTHQLQLGLLRLEFCPTLVCRSEVDPFSWGRVGSVCLGSSIRLLISLAFVLHLLELLADLFGSIVDRIPDVIDCLLGEFLDIVVFGMDCMKELVGSRNEVGTWHTLLKLFQGLVEFFIFLVAEFFQRDFVGVDLQVFKPDPGRFYSLLNGPLGKCLKTGSKYLSERWAMDRCNIDGTCKKNRKKVILTT